MPVVNAMNIILSAYPNRVVGGGVMVGRNKFFHPSPAVPPVPLGGGLEAWRGFYSSVRPAWKQLMVNVNVCTTAFYTPGNLAEKMVEFLNMGQNVRIASFVRGVRVRTTHLGYRKTAKTVAKVNARQHSFVAEGLGKVTVEQYFLRSELSFESMRCQADRRAQNTRSACNILTCLSSTLGARNRICSLLRSASSWSASRTAARSRTSLPGTCWKLLASTPT